MSVASTADPELQKDCTAKSLTLRGCFCDDRVVQLLAVAVVFVDAERCISARVACYLSVLLSAASDNAACGCHQVEATCLNGVNSM